MCKSIIYHTFVILLLSLVPIVGVAQQTADINKPTRTRTTEKNKKASTADNKNGNKTTQQDKQAAGKATDKKNEAPAAKAADTKKADNGTKAADTKKADVVAKPDVTPPASDTTGKAPAPKPKPKKVPVDPDKVQFDVIDVSKHQGYINWEELKKNPKIQCVYIRATVGSNVIDQSFKENLRNARKHGFKVGSYHYFTNLSSARAQFENFRNLVDRSEQDLLPMLDVEEITKWSKQQLRDSVMAFVNMVEDYYGCKPLIYTNEKFFTTNLGRAFADYPLFIAKYSAAEPNIGYKWVLWQFSDIGLFKNAVKGNRGEVDLSRFNKGCSVNDILYKPGKNKPKNTSVKESVDHKNKPATVNMTEQKPKETSKQTAKQQEAAKKQAEKERKAKERSKKLADEEAKKKAEADKKAKEKAEQQKREKARQAARDAEAKKEADAKAKREAEVKAKKEAEAKAKAKAEAEAKAKRKADAQKARQEKAQQSSGKSNKASSLMGTSSSKLSQSQRNDSIRNAKQQGRKTNKSSADND